MTTGRRTVIIGGAAGMWGDSVLATPQMLADGRCDYLIYEGLAEITMAILTKARARDENQGYARDLIDTIADNLRAFSDTGTKVVTNAGGVNPHAAAAVLRAAAARAGVRCSIGVVTGDDVLRTDLGGGTGWNPTRSARTPISVLARSPPRWTRVRTSCSPAAWSTAH
ncbi:acyclic terpene utilization AtuA family protein [Tsukamurella sp. PLM1]|uniref:acyclic terpene utilization AtuA family protein n=1 Tax=Tsukamurella sp. PLM1 TaxID=2929795 RepID=UPI0020710700|nr:acyclic terpene utilization AtuA family protein [Tsukamurella sp. PLM1]BDH59654.1 hypothetical protein MTP03_45930 [Tsukamurella sp. PLM1]